MSKSIEFVMFSNALNLTDSAWTSSMASGNSDIQPLQVPSYSGAHDQNLTHPHTLNRDRQTNKLIENDSWPPIDIEVNCNDENVNTKCSPGYYNLVTWPCLMSISPGHQITYNGITCELRRISLVFYNPLFSSTSLFKCNGVTVSLHHTTQNVQVQVGGSMSDGFTATTFILSNYLADLFASCSYECICIQFSTI